MLPARWRRQRATNALATWSAALAPKPLPVRLAFSPILIFVFVVGAGVLLGHADTCSYTFQCSGPQCAAVMGGWSGTRSSSGVTREQCESARKMAPSTSPCTCSSDSSSTTNNSGAIVSNTGNFKQDMVTNATNLFIVSHTTNPIVSSFMQGAATSFISSMFANNAEAQRQQQLMAQEILRRRQEQEEQRRIAEQQRLDAMFARLNRQLKLEGVPFGLSLKPMNAGADLQIKSMNSSSPDDLKLKMGNGYGINGLPGIYVGGPAGTPAPDNTSSVASGNAPTAIKTYGIAGLPGMHVGGPADPATAGGMPGLPGIYVNGAQPNQAPDLAQAAQSLDGPERALAQDAALQAAQQNPALSAASQDPRVQAFQQANQDYQQALQADASAGRDYQTAMGHVEADKSAIDVAQAQLRATTPTAEQQAAFNQMLSAAKTDEDAAAIARQGFDSTEIHLSASRDHAATALAATAPALVSNPASPQSSSIGDLSHASQPVTAPLLRTAAPAARSLSVATPAPLSLPAPVTAAAIVPVLDVNTCLANVTHSTIPLASRPSVEQLRAQLEIARGSLSQLLETHLRENQDRDEWAKDMKKGGLDIGYQAFDLTAKMVLGSYIARSSEEFMQASQHMRELQGALAAETSLAGQAALEAEINVYIQQRAQAGHALQLLKQVKAGVEQGGAVRDFRGWVTNNGESLEKNNPIALSGDGSPVPALDGIKQAVKITLSQKSVQETLENLAHTEPLVDRVVTAGNALIDTGYDLTVEYLGFQQLQQSDRNSELFYRAAAPLQQKIQVTAGQLKCYR